MDATLLVGLSQQLATYRSMDVIANNIANVSTPAFKRESVQFEEYVSQLPPDETTGQSQTISFVRDKGVVRDLNEGKLDRTNAPFDVAVSGKGYFVVQTANGNRYTRNGHFSLDSQGVLVTDDGKPVLGDGGPITVTQDDGQIHVAADGTVSGQKGQIGKLQLVTFPNELQLEKQGSSLYATTQAPTPATGTIVQGMIESSNVEPVVEIAHMIEVMRAYQATASLSQGLEDLVRQAIDKLGTPAS
jgi:flagellar basal-body rod protein FlgF